MAGKKMRFDVMHTLISWGASVVIVGAMFKILHLKNGELMIGAGLTVEAILFFVSGFTPPPKDPKWERVYPELSEDFTGELPKASARPAVAAVAAPQAPNAAMLDKMLQDAKVSPDLIQSLGDGLRSFGDKVAAISNTADTAQATTEFTSKLKQASSSFDVLNVSFESAASTMKNFNESVEDSKQFKEEVAKLAKNISSLNAVYGNMLSAMNQPRV